MDNRFLGNVVRTVTDTPPTLKERLRGLSSLWEVFPRVSSRVTCTSLKNLGRGTSRFM